MKNFIAYLNTAATNLQSEVDKLDQLFSGLIAEEGETANVYPEDDFGAQAEEDTE